MMVLEVLSDQEFSVAHVHQHCCCCYGVQGGSVPAQAQAPAQRRIAPELFPSYPGETVHAPKPRAPDSDHPHGSCELNVPRSRWLKCLRDTATVLDAKIDERVSSIAGQIESRPGMNPARARHWRAALEKAKRNGGS